MGRPTSIYKLRDQGLRSLNMGIYSWPGQGKTGLLGSGDSSVLIMDSDISGSDTAAAMGSEAYAVQVNDYHRLEEIYQFLANDNDPTSPDGFKTVCWDSVTLFQDRTLIDEILLDAYMANPQKQSPDVPSQREYLINMNRIGKYVRQFCELDNIDMVFTFHVFSVTTPDGEIMWAPMLQGKDGEFSTKISGYMNVLGHFYKKSEDDGKGNVSDVRYMRFVGNHEYVAKDRFHCLPPLMKNPTLPAILKRINAKKAEMAAHANAERNGLPSGRPSPSPAARPAKKAAAPVRRIITPK